jgi:hypothetical protein
MVILLNFSIHLFVVSCASFYLLSIGSQVGLRRLRMGFEYPKSPSWTWTIEK